MSLASVTTDFAPTSEKYTGLLQLSNDHSGRDNQGFHDVTKMILTFLLSSVLCLLIVLGVQTILGMSRTYRYQLVKLHKNYRNLKRASQLPLVST
jgi:hypothetical protein